MISFLRKNDGWPLVPNRNEQRGFLLLYLGFLLFMSALCWMQYGGRTRSFSTIPAERTYPDLNRDPAHRIEEIPGIGPVRAEAIARDRRENGPYETYDDLKRIHGIGPKTIEKMKTHSRLDGK